MSRTLNPTAVQMTAQEQDAIIKHVFGVLRQEAESADCNVSLEMTLPDGWVYSLSVKQPNSDKQ